ncbi:MAG: hypothetical protein IPP90_18025 [Gemmatimonadaceae bacterium]|nr:hypothetical protein [Gemmatimonadaceae bacterium]
MRPDVAAFRELDTLVRNLSEQLAGYRRRALAAESRLRELEQQLAMLAAMPPAPVPPATTPLLPTVPGGTGSSSDDLMLENERLRARLSEARERTVQVADRVRFLRQQLSSGAER